MKLKMELILLVAMGGAMGAVLRYMMGMMVAHWVPHPFPFATLFINILGCFLIGMLFFVLADNPYQESFRAFVVVGILGGFTTFSSFSMETVGLLYNGRYLAAIMYLTVSVFGGLGATMLGMKLLRVG